jgi:uncharacterized membrane protein
MSPEINVATLWLLFGGTHVGLAACRHRLVLRLGELGFTAVFYLVASVSFTLLVTYYAAHRFEGLPGPALGGIPWLRWPLMAAIVAGFALIVPALVSYPRLPTALFGQPIRSVRGIEGVTRHPFFAGTALLAVAHALLATRLVGTVFFSGLAALAMLGSWHQDRKLLARRGAAYGEYLSATSAVPFAAIVAGRQALVWRELPIVSTAIGAGLALLLRHAHDALFAGGGAWIAGTVVAGGTIAGLSAWRRSRRLTRKPRASFVASNSTSRWAMRPLAAPLLIATGIGHALLGFVLFREPLAAIAGDGVLDSIRYGQFDRAAAFWFLLFGPVCVALGRIVAHAFARGDVRLLCLIARHLLAIGAIGAAIMPISGFWLVIAIAFLVFRAAAAGASPRAAAQRGAP